jgi:hypothetical protein
MEQKRKYHNNFFFALFSKKKMFKNISCVDSPLPLMFITLVEMTRAPSNNDIAPTLSEIFLIVISLPILWVVCYYIGVILGCNEFAEYHECKCDDYSNVCMTCNEIMENE